MLFNSYEFIFLFLPLTAAIFFALSRAGLVRFATGWLALTSLFFYGYWSPRYVVLLLASIAVNYTLGRAILHRREQSPRAARWLLIGAVTINLVLLGYYKYANFFVDSLAVLTGAHLEIARIVLPIGISFFTFTQIAFLADTYQGKVRETDPLHYLLFVTYFPHLIAGPVLHHAEMMPQFARRETYRFHLGNFTTGVAFFVIGLFKKVVFADGIQPFVGPVFEAGPHATLTGLEAWGGALAYTMQLYFDFSGYSDMAIGLSKMFNVDLPLNFNSPYKALNISDFWRRWHMTLSRFLRDYLYIPLGGNRYGGARRYFNLFTTMLLGGLWHGAGWTFVVWGGLHGIYLALNHGWRTLRESVLGHDLARSSAAGRGAAFLATFLSVVVAWVFFRATSFDAAMRILTGMSGQHGWMLPTEWQAMVASLPGAGALHFGELPAFGGARQVQWTLLLFLIAVFLPNSQAIVGAATRKLNHVLAASTRERAAWAGLGAATVSILVIAAVNGSRGVSEFIYFNF